MRNNKITALEGDFDLRGYEIAHGQFFNSSGRAAINISSSEISFSAETVRKFGDISHVELLIHPEKMILAVRASTPSSNQAVIWSKQKNGKTLPKIIRGKAFLPTIFRLLNWKTKCKYKMLGILHEKDDEKVLLFDLKDTEIVMPSSFVTPSKETSMKPFTSGTSQKVLAYPADWSEGFGKKYYSRAKEKEIEEDALSDWNVTTESIPYKEPELKVTDRNTLNKEIKSIMSEMEVNTDA